jgi:hypothetical protein
MAPDPIHPRLWTGGCFQVGRALLVPLPSCSEYVDVCTHPDTASQPLLAAGPHLQRRSNTCSECGDLKTVLCAPPKPLSCKSPVRSRALSVYLVWGKRARAGALVVKVSAVLSVATPWLELFYGVSPLPTTIPLSVLLATPHPRQSTKHGPLCSGTGLALQHNDAAR